MKLVPVALGVVALASCSNEDFMEQNAPTKVASKGSIEVRVDDPVSDEATTRSAFYNGNKLMWQDATDKLRGYDEALQYYNTYTYAAETDKFSTEKNKVAEENVKYILFPTNAIESAGYDGELDALTALVALGVEDLEYAETTTADGTYPAYVSNIPMFGKITSFDDGKLLADAIYLTGWLKITLENGSENVKAIKVSTTDTEKYLSGYFDAVLDTEHNFKTDVNTSKLQKSSKASVADKYKQQIVVNTTSLPSFTSVVYVPVIADTYEELKVEYSKVGDFSDPTLITEYTNKEIKAGHSYAKDALGKTMSIAFEVKETASSFSKLQTIINKYAAAGKAVSLDVNEGGSALTAQPDDYTLTIPANAPAITLNLKAGLTNSASRQIEIVGGKNAGMFTLKVEGTYTAAGQALNLKAYEGNFTLSGFNAQNVWSQEATDVTLTSDNNISGTLRGFGANLVVKNASTISNEGAGTIETLAEGIVNSITSKGGDITVAGTVTTTIEQNGTGKVTIKKGASVGTSLTCAGTAGEIMVEEGASVKAITNNGNGNVTILGSQGTDNTDKLINNGSGTITFVGAKTVEQNGTGKVIIGTEETAGFYYSLQVAAANTGGVSGKGHGNWFTNNGSGDINLTIDGYLSGLANTGNGNVTIEGTGKEPLNGGLTSTGTGKVTVKNVTVAKDQIIKGGGDVEIDGVIFTDNGTVDATDGKAIISVAEAGNVSSVKFGTALELKAGTIYHLYYEGTENATITTTGKTAIWTVEKGLDKLTFTSTWDGESAMGDKIATGTGGGNIYTAAQLAGIGVYAGTEGLTLQADIDLKNKEWTPQALTKNFNGGNHKISFLKVTANTTDNVGLFSTVSNDVTEIKDIEFNKCAIDTKANNIGVLAGAITTSSSNDVTVSGVKVNTDGLHTLGNTAAEANTTAAVGGLFGKVTGNATKSLIIKGCSAEVQLYGYHSMGGLIGQIDGGKVQIGGTAATDQNTVNAAFAIKKAPATPTTKDQNYGKVGMLVGTVGGTSAELTINEAANAYSIAVDRILGRTDYYYDNNWYTPDAEIVKYHPAQELVGFSGTAATPGTLAGNITIGGKTGVVAKTASVDSNIALYYFE